MASFHHQCYVLLCFCLLFTPFSPVSAQQFSGRNYPFSYPAMRAACVSALNTQVSCSPILAVAAERDTVPRLKIEDLNAVCPSTCLTSLQNARSSILASCTATDIMKVGEQLYPATYVADLLIYVWNLMCRTDTATQKFCDVLVLEWLNDGLLTTAQQCSDCLLNAARLQLNSPFGYDAQFAVQFASITASCTKTGYAVTIPPPYAISTAGSSTTSSPPASPTLDSSCVTIYTIASGATCNSIAVARNVSSYSVYGPNGIKDCSSLPTGQKLCLLGQCRRYQIKQGDTCTGIIATTGKYIDPEIFVAWNPNINSVCSNLGSLIGQEICLSRPDGILNPDLTNDYVTSTVTAWPNIIPTIPAQLPTAPGTISGCTQFVNYEPVVAVQDQYYSPQSQFTLSIANTCDYITGAYNATLEEFLSWNPSLNILASCKLISGYSYCVDHPSRLGVPNKELISCFPVNPAIIPQGTIGTCTCYKQYVGADIDWADCSTYKDDYNVTASQLQTWNPWIGTNCDTGLFANLPISSSRGICIATTGSLSSYTASSTSTSKSSVSTSNTILSTTTTGLSTLGPVSSTVASSTTTTRISTVLSSSSTINSSTTISTSPIPSNTTPSTTTLPPTTTTKTTSSVSSSSTANFVCIGGTGVGNQAGLCDYCCHLGYCPAVCTCLAWGLQVTPPAATWPPGYPAAGLDSSYLGLCSFACNHGYCPPGACTTTPP